MDWSKTLTAGHGRWFAQGAATAGLVLGVAFVAYLLVRLVPGWLVDTDGLTAVQRDEALGRGRTALFALLAGLIALLGALYTARTYALNRRGQITERFSRAIEHLGDERIAVRLGGIYALERIAHESEEEHGPIIEVLTAYVRENSRWPADGSDVRAAPPLASVDVKAILAVLARRNTEHERHGAPRIDLSWTNLRGIVAHGINLTSGNLRGAQLQDADLRDAQLENVSLAKASLERARLLNARLEGSSLAQANLTNTIFTGADVRESTLHRAVATRAVFYGTDLTGTLLEGVDLREARASSSTVWPADFDPREAGVRVRPG